MCGEGTSQSKRQLRSVSGKDWRVGRREMEGGSVGAYKVFIGSVARLAR